VLTTDYVGNLGYENDRLKYILHQEGCATKSSAGYAYNYYLKDHLGNNRKVGDQINNYYPSGMTNLYISFNSERQPYKFGGKELDEMHGLNWYYQGARPFDAIIPRTPTIDPLAEKYYNTSPYVQWGNNPVNAVDRDGRLVIFINGMHSGTGGTGEYWRNGRNFFDLDVMEHLNDYSALYRDGSVGGRSNLMNNTNADYRFEHGETMGKIDAGHIIRRITGSDGNLKETIKIITHSMGAAYAKGYVKALLAYFKENGIPIGILEFEADFAPYQPDKQKANSEVNTYQFSHSKDWVAGNAQMDGANYMDTSSDKNQTHWINDFWSQVQNLPAGNYTVVNWQIVAN
jgi:RHS repeat-associated protein